MKQISVANGNEYVKTADAVATSTTPSKPDVIPTIKPTETPSPSTIITPNSEKTPSTTNTTKPIKTPSSSNHNQSGDTRLPQTGVNNEIFLMLGIGIALITIVVYIVMKNKKIIK